MLAIAAIIVSQILVSGTTRSSARSTAELDLRWEASDANSARATLQVGETTASGVLTFTEDGDLLRFEAPSPSPAG